MPDQVLLNRLKDPLKFCIPASKALAESGSDWPSIQRAMVHVGPVVAPVRYHKRWQSSVTKTGTMCCLPDWLRLKMTAEVTRALGKTVMTNSSWGMMMVRLSYLPVCLAAEC